MNRRLSAIAMLSALAAGCTNAATATPAATRTLRAPSSASTQDVVRIGDPAAIAAADAASTRPLPVPTTRCGPERPASSWSPPAGLDPTLAHATAIVFALGLPDPRGLEFVSATVVMPSLTGAARTAQINGWALRDGSTPLLLTPRGDLVAVQSWGARVTLSSASLAASAADNWNDARTQRAQGALRSNHLTAILLARLGLVREANERWSAAPTAITSRHEQSALLDLAETHFDSALGALRLGHPAASIAMLSVLECARPFIEEHANALTLTTSFIGMRPHSVQERTTEFLAAVPQILDESRRVAGREPIDVRAIDLATAPAATLISALETFSIDDDKSELAAYESNPLLLALRSRGSAIASELISAFESDTRLTRAISHDSYPLRRFVLPVRAPLAWLISEVTGIYPAEWGWRSFSNPADVRPADATNAIRRRWDEVRSLSPYDCALSGVSDNEATFERQILAIAPLFASADPDAQRVLLRSGGPRIINPFVTATRGVALTPAQRQRLFDAVRRRVAPLVAISSESRDTLISEDRRCGYGQMLYLLDANAAMPVLRETLERLHAREPDYVANGCSAWLAGALVANHDPDAAATIAHRLRNKDFRDGELGEMLDWWTGLEARSEATPMYEALAHWAQRVRGYPVQTAAGRQDTVYSPAALSIVTPRSIRAQPIRSAVLALLEDQRLAAVIRYERGSESIRYLNARGMHTLRARQALGSTDVIPPDTNENERLMDVVADFLADRAVLATPVAFDLRWSVARRSQAIDAMKTQLRGR